ncbi:hypothetical protein ACFMKD_04075, partial [Acinetobacter baumannii]
SVICGPIGCAVDFVCRLLHLKIISLKNPLQIGLCNKAGYNYKNYQRGGAIHPYEEDTLIWFPRLYENKDWINTISPDGLTITEKSTDETITLKKLEEWKNGPQKRIVFARVKDNLNSRAMYRFMGLYKFQKADLKDGAVWKRVECEVQTYSPKETKC